MSCRELHAPESPRLNFITDPWFYAWAIPAVIITGISKTGPARASAAAVPMMSQVIARARRRASCCRFSA